MQKLKKIHFSRAFLLRKSWLSGRPLLTLMISLLLVVGVGTQALCFSVGAEDLSTDISFTDPDGQVFLVPQGDVVAELVSGISAVEKAYLNAQSKYKVTASQVPDKATYAHVQEDHVVAVAYEYSYVTADGTAVTWIPLFAENMTDPSEGMVFFDYVDELGFYRCNLRGKKDHVIQVYYTASFRLSETLALDMINEAPTAAAGLLVHMSAYEADLLEWTTQKDAYDAYLITYQQWEDAVQAYNDYVAAKEAHDDWLAQKAVVDAYMEQKAAYDRWKKYETDLAAYEAYMALVQATPELKAEYEKKMTTVLHQLTVMDRMFITSDISGYSFAGVLNSGPANFILENKTLLQQVQGVKEEDVDTAVKATRALQSLVPAYEVLTDREDKYEYYKTYGAEILGHTEALYDSIISLGKIPYVYQEIQDRGGLEAYLQFLANLYVQSRLMDDQLDLDLTISHHGYPLSVIIDPELLMPDTNQMAPLDAYPHPPTTSDDVVEVPYPGDPPLVAEDPGEAPPPLSEEPVLPDEVLPAGDPPVEVQSPGNEPTRPEMTEEEEALWLLAKEGRLETRSHKDLSSGGSFSLMSKKDVKVISGRRFKVTVKNYLGGTDYWNYYTCGTYIDEQLSQPTLQPEDPHMQFVGWSISPVPLPETEEVVYPTLKAEDIVSEMTLYPVYRMAHEADGEPSCTQDQRCRYCGVKMADKTGHVYSTEIISPTCTGEGYTLYTCSLCGDRYTADLVASIGHNWSEWESIIEPTEEADGQKRRVCFACQTIETALIPMLGHVHRYVSEIVLPTCTEQGYTYYVCVCLDSYKEAYKPALGHTCQNLVTPPTCTEQGYTTHVCTVCGDSYEDEHMNAKGHIPNVPASCTQDSVCLTCGILLEEKIGHQYKHTMLPPTCTESGYTLHVCDLCGDRYQDAETASLGHRFGEWVIDRQPSYESEGHRYAQCLVCKYQIDEILPVLPPIEDNTEFVTQEETVPDTEPVTEPDTESVTEPDTTPDTLPETDSDPSDTQEPVTSTDETESSEEPITEEEEIDTLPSSSVPEVKWYARLLGSIGLPTLVVIAGMLLGAGTAGVVILMIRGRRKRHSD